MKGTSFRARRRRDPAAEERRAARREELLEAAVRAIRRQGPGASMGAIATEAGCAKPILYRHFGDKAGLYQAVADRYVSLLLHEVSAAFAENVETRDLIAAAVDAYLRFIERETEIYRFLWMRMVPELPRLHASLADFQDRVAQELTRLLRDRLKPAGVDTGGADPWAHALVGMATAVGEWWLEDRSMSRKHVGDYLTELLWGGFSGITRAFTPLIPE
ncbi:MAG TPA: TetR/AcrR family transcriptional regulator [Actinomycetota bacterium]|nr:TetR/AcrR family transcriptional regulator [Actinomycetota bacterium]